MAHFKAKLKSNDNNTSPCFKPFFQETCSHIIVYLDSVWVTFRHFYQPYHFTGIPNSLRILCKTSHLTESWASLNSMHCHIVFPLFVCLFVFKYLTNFTHFVETHTIPNNFLLHMQSVKYTFIYLQLAWQNPWQNTVKPWYTTTLT